MCVQFHFGNQTSCRPWCPAKECLKWPYGANSKSQIQSLSPVGVSPSLEEHELPRCTSSHVPIRFRFFASLLSACRLPCSPSATKMFILHSTNLENERSRLLRDHQTFHFTLSILLRIPTTKCSKSLARAPTNIGCHCSPSVPFAKSCFGVMLRCNSLQSWVFRSRCCFGVTVYAFLVLFLHIGVV